MIQKIKKQQNKMLKELAYQDIARNYFICLGLEEAEKVYEAFYECRDEEGVYGYLLQRKSGNFQLISIRKSQEEIFLFLKQHKKGKLIVPASYLTEENQAMFKFVKKDAYIAAYKGKSDGLYEREKPRLPLISKMKLSDLEEVAELYDTCFAHHGSVKQMSMQFQRGQSRGVLIWENNKIIACARTACETKREALIVGVATHLDYRRKGLATLCVDALLGELVKEQRAVFLQYNDKEAGRIYEKLGFVPVDRVLHCTL